ncbi:MAG: alpha/beta hydrolase [Phormidesmis priestleyi]|uniref:Alpha/beta hydrolase n=1 Tax=Phormidesmis priestleyi TaxID=268141 RepID=A0A2W4ZI69_9CYAN|nr:MAG: alpha/beta hydrolase [Phormidesmis priestleyi]
MDFYTWQNHRCAFEKVASKPDADSSLADSGADSGADSEHSRPALLLIHPIGVGLSHEFWQPFVQQFGQQEAKSESVSCRHTLYNVDLLGCGDSDMPNRAYRPEDWAEQLAYFIEQIASEPVVLVVQGALLPVAIRLMGLPAGNQVKGLVLSGPPAWRLMTTPTPSWQQKLSWALFESPLGSAFYRYARRESFLRSFSERQLFERPEGVTDDWLAMLKAGAKDMNSRYAVFSFLAGFWRQDYAAAIARIQQPVLIVMGDEASSIDRTTAKQAEAQAQANSTQTSQQRLQAYLDHFPRAQGVCIAGRNVLPYESTAEFVEAVVPFIANLA